MILLVFLVFLESPVIGTGRLDFLFDDEFLGRDDLVKWAGYGEEKLSTVEIGGKLLCHGGGAIVNPYPVSGATVCVFCGKNSKMKKSWAKGSTDSSGSFLIDLPSHLHAIPNLEKTCHVRVVRLPKTSPCCSRKHKPIKLSSSMGEGIRSYTTNNIHLMPHKHT
ncbi:hypothetical protein PHJA_002824300 [Phtheirospermum japonicum]|uniref:Uncharacterized protein n=1 Tax=Phtheirospermum japonicum TaxID=374723 RepID=A0A830D821_9LAMI|nr:hypothetical protein PHJA_002824300 [Phtheirospermum japonicum]